MFDPATDCIYCEGRSGDAEFTLEHIWPQALGGSACSDIFKTRQVCRRCNNTVGQWVDGAFLKSFFIQGENAVAAHAYLDPNKSSAPPLVYAGFEQEFPLGKDEVCERWIGPAGESIYHIHQRDDDRWSTISGGNYIQRKSGDGGRAYIALTSPSMYWHETALKSFVRHFPKASRRCVTPVDGAPLPEKVKAFDEDPINDKERTEISFIRSRPVGTQHMSLPVNVNFSDRFLAKLSIGLAHTILGPSVSASPYVSELRKLLWSKSPDEPRDIAVFGSGFWDNRGADDRIMKSFPWLGAWMIALVPFKDAFGLVLYTPGGKGMSMMISDDPSLWPQDTCEKYGQGVVHLIVPERQLAVGPIPLLRYVAHKGGGWKHPDLEALERMRIDINSLPQKHTAKELGGNEGDGIAS